MTSQMNQFMTDEYVLAYHGPLLYEARVSHRQSNHILIHCSLRAHKASAGGVEPQAHFPLSDHAGRKLDRIEHTSGNNRSSLLHPLQRMETNVSDLPAPPISAPTLTHHSRWDEWVPEPRLLKLNEAGFAKRRQLFETQTKKNRPVAMGLPGSPSTGAKGKDKAGKKGEGSRKRARDSGVDNVS